MQYESLFDLPDEKEAIFERDFGGDGEGRGINRITTAMIGAFTRDWCKKGGTP